MRRIRAPAAVPPRSQRCGYATTVPPGGGRTLVDQPEAAVSFGRPRPRAFAMCSLAISSSSKARRSSVTSAGTTRPQFGHMSSIPNPTMRPRQHSGHCRVTWSTGSSGVGSEEAYHSAYHCHQSPARCGPVTRLPSRSRSSSFTLQVPFCLGRSKASLAPGTGIPGRARG